MKSESAPLRSQFFRGNRLNFALALGASLLTAGLNLLIARVLQQMIDAVSGVPGAPGLGSSRSTSASYSLIAAVKALNTMPSRAFWSGRCGSTRTVPSSS
ncbi:MAG: hypothetical protein ACLUEK_16245 [Oscillospiraceae bacterium]